MRLPTPDEVTAAVATAGFLLSVLGLVWQWRTREAAKSERIQIEAAQQASGVWLVLIKFKETDRSQRLRARVRLLHPKGASLLIPIFAPKERNEFNENVRRWDQIDTSKGKLDWIVPLEHQASPSEMAGELVVLVPDWTVSAGLKITVEETARRRSRATRMMVINPTT